MKKFALFLILCLQMMAFAFAEDYESEVTQMFKDENYEECLPLIQKWEKSEPDNLEINIYYFNYYMYRNANHVSILGQMKDGRYGFYDKTEYDLKDVKKAVSYFDKILKKQPNRLDVRSSKCTAYIYSEQYKLACSTLIEILDLSKKNNNQWTWSENKPLEEWDLPDGEALLFAIVNECYQELYDPFDSNKDYIKKIIEKEIALYPENTWALNHAARYYMGIEDYTKCIELLTRAVELDPSDYIVVGNLAYSYELSEDYQNARKWYEYMLTMDNPDAVEYGRQGLGYIEGKY